MAKRRMFSKDITNSARFLMMPQTSRLLYYDLGMAADDDGIVEAFTVLRMTGAAEDDLRVLAAKDFVTILNEELVSYINDWKVNNYIQNDRYTPSIYRNLLVKVNDFETDTECIQDGYTGKARIGKDRLGKDSIGEESDTPTLAQVLSFCEDENLPINGERFFNYYSGRGWKTGNAVISDWKAVARSWTETEKPKDDVTNKWNIQYS